FDRRDDPEHAPVLADRRRRRVGVEEGMQELPPVEQGPHVPAGRDLRAGAEERAARAASVRWRAQDRADALGQERLPVNPSATGIAARVARGRESRMLKKMLPAVPTIVALVALAGLRSAGAQAMLDRDWVLDPRQSHLYMQTEKGDHIVEKHEFTSIAGNVSRTGDASLKIDLATLETGIDIRNVRMRFLLFETFKFPTAE